MSSIFTRYSGLLTQQNLLNKSYLKNENITFQNFRFNWASNFAVGSDIKLQAHGAPRKTGHNLEHIQP